MWLAKRLGGMYDTQQLLDMPNGNYDMIELIELQSIRAEKLAYEEIKNKN